MKNLVKVLTLLAVAGLMICSGCKNPASSQTTPSKIIPPTTCWPSSGSTIYNISPLLDWEDVTDSTGYHVQVNTSGSFNGIMVEDNDSVTTSQHQVTTTLTDNTTYYWHVRVKNADDVWGNWSSTWNFTVDVSPLTPVWPSDGSLIYDTTPLLTWGDATGASKYHVQVNISDSFNGSIIEENDDLSASQFQVSSALLDNTTYYWHVRMQDGEGMWGDWSGIWSFTVDIAPPNTPSPSNGSVTNNTTPLLDWDDVIEAASYHVQLSDNDSFSGPMIEDNDTVLTSQYQMTTALSDGATCYWHVRVQNEDGYWGDWSDIWDFSVDISPPVVNTAPTLNADETYTRDSDVTVFHSVSEATQMIMSEDSSFSGSSWVAYQENPIFALSAGDETKTVYIKYRDDAGNETGTYSDTIVYDHNVYVSSSGSDSNAGTPDLPLLTLSAGVSLAQTSMPVEVRVEGSPAGILYDLGSVGLSIPTSVSLMGGYNSDFSSRDSGTYISKITSTNTYTILFDGSDITPTTILDGFTITNTASFEENVYTVYCRNSTSPRISHNIITNEATNVISSIENSAATACIFSNSSSPVIEYNEIIGGSGTHNVVSCAGSAGIFCRYGNPVIQNNISIMGGNGTSNSGVSAGSAGIYCSNSDATIINNQSIYGGSGDATTNGYHSAGSAGIYCYFSDATISGNKTIDGGNGSVRESAGSVGIYYYSCSPNISNNELIVGGSGISYSQHSAGSAGIAGRGSPIISGNLQISGGSGEANGPSFCMGSAGIYCGWGTPTVRDNLFIYGGSGNSIGEDSVGSTGIRCHISDAIIYNNQVINGGTGTASGNTSAGSAGVFCYLNEDKPPRIYNNMEITSGNGSATGSSSAGGAGIYCTHTANAIIYNNVIIGESASATNNAFVDTVSIWFNAESSGKVANNVLIHQTSNEYSIGIYLGEINDVRTANNIIFSADGTNRFGVYENAAGCDPTHFFNNLIFDCPSGLYYDEGTTAITDISEVNALSECSDNITTTQTLSQLFVGGSPFDYHLTSGSDAIDAGFNTSSSYWGEVTDDIDGETRPKGSAYDIGFDEY